MAAGSATSYLRANYKQDKILISKSTPDFFNGYTGYNNPVLIHNQPDLILSIYYQMHGL